MRRTALAVALSVGLMVAGVAIAESARSIVPTVEAREYDGRDESRRGCTLSRLRGI